MKLKKKNRIPLLKTQSHEWWYLHPIKPVHALAPLKPPKNPARVPKNNISHRWAPRPRVLDTSTCRPGKGSKNKISPRVQRHRGAPLAGITKLKQTHDQLSTRVRARDACRTTTRRSATAFFFSRAAPRRENKRTTVHEECAHTWTCVVCVYI